LPFSGETEIQGTEILKKEEILDAKIAKFLSVRLKKTTTTTTTTINKQSLLQFRLLLKRDEK